MRGSIRVKKSIHTEVSITGYGIRFIMLAMHVCFLTIDFYFHSLIHPIPDETSLQAIVFPDDVPVIDKVSIAIAHSVAILT